MRTVILHYHIYKNAGTSFDHVLTHNFGGRHELFDGPFSFFTIDQDQLDRIIMRRPNAVAFSSHQIVLPAPSSLDYRALAAIFVRNPFLRIASIYRFKRGPERPDGTPLGALSPEDLQAELARRALEAQRAANPEAGPGLPPPDPLPVPEFDTSSTAQAARKHDMAGWIEHCLSSRSEVVHVSNAQTRFFASPYRTRPLHKRSADGLVYDIATALRMLTGVELLGRTEHFEADVARFGDILAPHGLTLNLPEDTRHNVTHAGTDSTAERVEAMLSSLSPDLRDRLIRANRQDSALYDRACALIERDHRI
ncbi:hypothetical protein [Paracoccus niistensis]|uniref:Sulfotransferase family protein n=1 Tax=Paracoccus niistensis TaxID=632935 RepID=A0ABV6I7Y5_9RHOB